MADTHAFRTSSSGDGRHVIAGCACGWQGGTYPEETDAYADAQREYDEHVERVDEPPAARSDEEDARGPRPNTSR